VSLLAWNASYSVNVASCDDDHKKLASLINSLQESMRAGKGAEVIQHVVEELSTYAEHHFSTEESMMEKTQYPDLASHRHEHQEFLNQIRQFQRDLAAGKFVSSLPVAAFLNDWFTNHIILTDQKYSTHLNANGIF
jgi:hemerythrin